MTDNEEILERRRQTGRESGSTGRNAAHVPIWAPLPESVHSVHSQTVILHSAHSEEKLDLLHHDYIFFLTMAWVISLYNVWHEHLKLIANPSSRATQGVGHMAY